MKNSYRPKASIVERYIIEEAIEFCTKYLLDMKPVGIPKSRHVGRCDSCKKIQAYFHILNNTIEIVEANNPKLVYNQDYE